MNVRFHPGCLPISFFIGNTVSSKSYQLSCDQLWYGQLLCDQLLCDLKQGEDCTSLASCNIQPLVQGSAKEWSLGCVVPRPEEART